MCFEHGRLEQWRLLSLIYIGVQLDVTLILLFYIKQLYMFRALLAHHQEILYCLVSRSLWQTVICTKYYI
jgi:hypothetical protein